jgi:hypothetical protein
MRVTASCWSNARKILHMQAGQCGNQMGTDF